MWRDLLEASRQLLRRPGWTAFAVLVLAAAVTSATAVFVLVDASLLRPLAIQEPSRVVRLFASDEGNTYLSNWSYPRYREFRDRVESFDGVAAYSGWAPLHVADGETAPERAHGALATGGFFSTLGVAPVIGRVFVESDDAPGAPPVAVLGHRWFERHGGDPSVLGRTIRVNGEPVQVVGVLPRAFRGVDVGAGPEVWLPMSAWRLAMPTVADRDVLAEEMFSWLEVIARLAPGATREQAAAEAVALARHDADARGVPQDQRVLPRTLGIVEASIDPYGDQGVRRMTTLLLLCVGALLLIAAFDVAGLMLVRRDERRSELAVRLGLGATPARLARGLMLEAALIGIAASVASIALYALVAGFADHVAMGSALPLPLLQEASWWTVGGVALATAAVAAGFAAAVPALGLRRLAPAEGIRAQSAGVVAGGDFRKRGAAIALQVALSLALLVATLMLGRSLLELARVDPGFRPDGVATASVDFALQGYDEVRGVAAAEAMRETLAARPGVLGAALAINVPVWSGGMRSSYTVDGQAQDPSSILHADLLPVSAGYFETLGIPLLRGRDFGPSDRADGERVGIVSRAFAEKHWPNADALGRQVMLGRESLRIVGVAGDVAQRSLREPRVAAVYVPLAQRWFGRATLVARVAPGRESALTDDLRAAVAAHDGTLPVYAVRTLREQIGQTIDDLELVAGAVAAVGAVALLLTLAGLYGLFAQRVRVRRREIGLRIALGADAARVVRLVVGEGGALVAAGVAGGVLLSLGLKRLLEGSLYGVGGLDPTSLALGAVAIVVVGAVALAGPAWRAATVDPQRSLRAE